MSEVIATYTFLPWLRRGVASRIEHEDGSGPVGPRVEIEADIEFSVRTVSGATETRSAAAHLALYGPGELTSLDTRAIVRTFPAPRTSDAEPFLFPAIEFDQADLPWRYTPARANANDRLRPWLVLIALEETEIDSFVTASENRPASVTVKSSDTLPDLAQSWAWSHVQVSGIAQGNPEDLQTILEDEPERVISRLLCARQIRPRTGYTCYLVPAFERARLRGLGETVDEAIDALEPAWSAGEASVRLPVYYSWSFQSGTVGDFEFLARKLKPYEASPRVGFREIDMSAPGAGLPAAAPVPLAVEGALRAVNMAPPAWPTAEQTAFVAALRTLVNAPEAMRTGGSTLRIVAPPLYGQWHAAQKALTPGARPAWFNELNADPRLRVGAGLGTLVVQQQQQQLMASAWEQVEHVLELNRTMRDAQLSREVTDRVHERHISTLQTAGLLSVTTQLHGKLTASPQTIRSTIAASPLRAGVFSGAFRRLTRARGAVARRVGGTRAFADVVTRTNTGDIRPAPPPVTPESLPTFEQALEDAVPSQTDAIESRSRWSMLLLILALILAVLGLFIALAAGALVFAAAAFVAAGAAFTASQRLQSRADAARTLDAVRSGTLTRETVENATMSADYVPTATPVGGGAPVPLADISNPQARSAAVNAARAALADLVEAVYSPVAAGTVLKPIAMQHIHERIIVQTSASSVVAAITSRLQLADWVKWKPEDPLEPVMAAPEFPQPMYEPLRDVSRSWILPGAEELPNDSVSLLETNTKFVEAYMLGLNHEMARELLWQEYPTDQRGTYFRQFWDVRGYVAEPDTDIDPESLTDIEQIHMWSRTAPLGSNPPQSRPAEEHLVLLIRGELLRRFPNTRVYAERAKFGSNGARELNGEQRFPIFEGTLPSDISFFGFSLSAEEVNGTGTDPGWFFILQEQPSDPHFGLDVPTTYGGSPATWNDISWGHLAASQSDLDQLAYIDLNAALPDTRFVSGDGSSYAWHADAGTGDTGATAAHLAYITLQRPFRVAMHASSLLPEP